MTVAFVSVRSFTFIPHVTLLEISRPLSLRNSWEILSCPNYLNFPDFIVLCFYIKIHAAEYLLAESI